MHEVSIADALLNEASTAAASHGLRAVDRVGVRVGRLSGVSSEALATAFEILRAGPVLGRAVLDIEEAEGTDLRLAWLEGE
jgi:Zn finger protein HypA/HybF involved in hydrogenase expression